MSSPALEPERYRDEEERIVGWRCEQLMRWYETDKAGILAARFLHRREPDREYVDLHLAIKLRERGCPEKLALEILL